jgi:hypothetical protein
MVCVPGEFGCVLICVVDCVLVCVVDCVLVCVVVCGLFLMAAFSQWTVSAAVVQVLT